MDLGGCKCPSSQHVVYERWGVCVAVLGAQEFSRAMQGEQELETEDPVSLFTNLY